MTKERSFGSAFFISERESGPAQSCHSLEFTVAALRSVRPDFGCTRKPTGHRRSTARPKRAFRFAFRNCHCQCSQAPQQRRHQAERWSTLKHHNENGLLVWTNPKLQFNLTACARGAVHPPVRCRAKLGKCGSCWSFGYLLRRTRYSDFCLAHTPHNG
jgi:hypothetical protein